jgi:hypothetical protein
MVRYEGMEDILQALRERLSEDTSSEPSSVLPLSTETDLRSGQDVETVELLVRLLGEARRLRERIEVEGVRGMTPREHEDAVALLGKILQELWRCESVLQGVAPHD